MALHFSSSGTNKWLERVVEASFLPVLSGRSHPRVWGCRLWAMGQRALHTFHYVWLNGWGIFAFKKPPHRCEPMSESSGPVRPG